MTHNAETLAVHNFEALAATISGWRSGQPEATVAEIESTHPGLLDRLPAAAGLLSAVAASADPDLVPQSLASGTRSHADAIINSLAQVATGSREPHLSQIENDHLPSLMSSLVSWPHMRLNSEEEIAAVTGAFRRATSAEIADVRAETRQVREEAAALQGKIAETEATLAHAREELAQLREAISTQRVRLDEVGATAQTTFAEAEGRRTTDFTTTLAELRTTADTKGLSQIRCF